MKSQPDHNGITLLVVRDAGRPVRQLQLSKPMALALPAAAALSISSLVTSMHFHASRSIAELEAEAAALSQTNLRMEMKVSDKDQALQQLRSQVTELSEEAESIRDKLKNVSELEQQLQSLIDKENNSTSDAASGTTTGAASSTASGTSTSFKTLETSPQEALPTSSRVSFGTTAASAASSSPAIRFRIGAMTGALGITVTPQVGGEYVAVHKNDPFQLVEETKDDFEEIHSILDEMVNRISNTITQAKEAHTLEATIQAKKVQEQKERMKAAVMWPTLSKVITSNFGYRTDPFKGLSAFHAGIDIAGSVGDPVYAALDGEVVAVDHKGARGKYVVIKHTNGLETWYMHLSGMNVTPGDKVDKGQKIGLVGNTGRSTGPHLHFQVVKQNNPVNPLAYVKP